MKILLQGHLHLPNSYWKVIQKDSGDSNRLIAALNANNPILSEEEMKKMLEN
jgi:hypothetical protein